jgi:hypothetical protein
MKRKKQFKQIKKTNNQLPPSKPPKIYYKNLKKDPIEKTSSIENKTTP